MKSEPYLVTGTLVDPSQAQYHQNAVVATVVGGGYGDPYAPMGGNIPYNQNTGLVVTASPLNMPAHFSVNQHQYQNQNIHNQNGQQPLHTNSLSMCAIIAIGMYVFLAVAMIIIGIVCLVTLPPGHCDDGCYEATCTQDPAVPDDDDRTTYPCTCPDDSAAGRSCEDTSWNGPGTAQYTAGAVLISLGSFLGCCSPCWCCVIFGSVHLCGHNRVAVANHGYNNYNGHAVRHY